MIRTVFERNRDAGVYAAGTGTTLSLTDVAVRETQSQETDGMFGRGLGVYAGAEVEVARSVFERNRDVGMLVDGSGTTLSLTDVAVLETQSQETDGLFGNGLVMRGGAEVEVIHAVFVRNRSVGVYATDAGTTLILTDVAVRETRSQEFERRYGYGLGVRHGAEVEVRSTVFEHNREAGVVASGSGTFLSLTNVLARETRSRERDGRYGHGLVVVEGAEAEVSRALFDRNRAVGVLAFETGTILQVTDVVVHETLESECAPDSCEGFGGGVGIGSYGGASVDVTRFTVTQNAMSGVQLAHGGSLDENDSFVPYEHGGFMDLHSGEVSNNPIGANVQTEGFDINRLMDNVIYVANERSLDMTELPVPELGDPLSEIDQ